MKTITILTGLVVLFNSTSVIAAPTAISSAAVGIEKRDGEELMDYGIYRRKAGTGKRDDGKELMDYGIYRRDVAADKRDGEELMDYGIYRRKVGGEKRDGEELMDYGIY